MDGCIFCKIGSGEIKSFQLYEDDLVKAFLDVNPSSDGHVLVISKNHYENIFEAPDDVLARINKVCKKMAILCKDKLGATGVNVLNASGKDAQQSVFHVHYHIVPRHPNDDLNMWFKNKSKHLTDLKEIQQKLLS